MDLGFKDKAFLDHFIIVPSLFFQLFFCFMQQWDYHFNNIEPSICKSAKAIVWMRTTKKG